MLTVIFKLIGLNLRSTKCKLSVTYLSHDFKRLKKDEFVNSFPKFVLFLYYRRFEELKNYTFVVCFMVFNATFNNISFISCRSVLLVEEAGGPRENHRPVIIH
jgi:hypothetical protein